MCVRIVRGPNAMNESEAMVIMKNHVIGDTARCVTSASFVKKNPVIIENTT